MLCYFQGVIAVVYAGLLDPLKDCAIYCRCNLTLDVQEDAHRNLMSLNDYYDIDIPPSMWDIAVYRASLGHKVNHHFHKTNTVYGTMKHPRFGTIRNVVAIEDIQAGEELFVDYDYNPDNFTPRLEVFESIVV